MSKSRNLADLLDANGDVQTNALDNAAASDAGLSYLSGLSFTDEASFKAGVNLEVGTDVLAPNGDGSGLSGIASDALSKSFTVETGGATTANNAVSVGGAGAVGKYPSPHTVGTAYDDTSETSATKWTISGNGKTGCRFEATIPTNGTYRVTVYGTTFPNDGDGVEGSSYTYDVGFSTGSVSYNYSWSHIGYIGYGNKFHVFLGLHVRTPGTHSNKSYHLVVSVDESTGNVTKVSENDIGETWGNDSLSRAAYFTAYDHASESIAWVWGATASGAYRWYHQTYQSGSWVGATSDTSTGNIGNSGLTFYATNKIAVVSGGNAYTITKDASNRWQSSDLSSPTAILDNYSAASSAYYPSTDRAVVYYEDGNGFSHINVFDVSSSDGSFTETDSIVIDKDTVLGGNSIVNWFSKDKSNIGFTSSTTVTTFTINASGKIENFSPSLTYNTIKRVAYSGTDELTMHRFPVSNLTRTPITINQWSSDPFQLIGLANSSASAGSTVDVTVAGVKGGFTGLSVGKVYCINKTLLDGSIVLSDSTDAGEAIGRAISSTEILVGDTA